MATCSVPELQQQACDNSFASLSADELSSRAVELQQLYLIAGETSSLSDLWVQACENGFDKVAAITTVSHAVEIQQLCNILGGT